jgi:beta-N-acetylhexosaminidase
MVQDVIRGSIGFEGALMSDDISMGALSGPLKQRAEEALRAGCDLILHCNGDIAEMRAIAGVVPRLAGRAELRTAAALKSRRRPLAIDVAEARATFADLFAPVRDAGSSRVPA